MAAKGRESLTRIQESLEQQLRDLGADVPHFQEQINNYVFFCKMERKAQADIKKNGTLIKAISASGKEYDKENPAIKQAALFSDKSLNILRQLGLSTDTCRKPDESDGDL